MKDPVLLIGAGGFVGQSLLDAFARRGEPVIAVSRSDFAVGDEHVERHVLAMHEAGDYAPFLGRIRAVIHVASASTPGSSSGKPLQDIDHNLRPTVALLEAMQAWPRLPLIYVSSGGTLYSRVADGASDELAAVYACSYHGAGKIAAEHYIEAWCNQFSGSAVVFRPSNLYGPGQVERPDFGVIPAAFGKIVRDETLHVWGDGSAERDYLYIDDFTRLILAALDAQSEVGFRVFNACSGTSVDLNGLLTLIERVTGHSLRRVYEAGRPVDVPSVRMQASRAKETFGWTVEVELTDGLERTWHRFNATPR